MRIPFNLKDHKDKLLSGEYKIDTREHEKVELVKFDADEQYPVVGLITVGEDRFQTAFHFDENGSCFENSVYDLFTITPEPEPTDFERALADSLWVEFCEERVSSPNDCIEFARRHSKQLVDLANKDSECTRHLVPVYDDKDNFETALEKAWVTYRDGSMNVDKFEDNFLECVHAKGFREGFLFAVGAGEDKVTYDMNTVADLVKTLIRFRQTVPVCIGNSLDNKISLSWGGLGEGCTEKEAIYLRFDVEGKSEKEQKNEKTV